MSTTSNTIISPEMAAVFRQFLAENLTISIDAERNFGDGGDIRISVNLDLDGTTISNTSVGLDLGFVRNWIEYRT